MSWIQFESQLADYKPHYDDKNEEVTQKISRKTIVSVLHNNRDILISQ